MSDLAIFLRLIRGPRPEWPRRVLAVAASSETVATIRADRIHVEAVESVVVGAWPGHSFDGVWLGRFEPASELCAELFRIIHHGWVRVPITADRWRGELLLERAGLRTYSETEDALIVRTQLITPKIGAGGLVFDDQGRLLLCQRADGGGWCIPGGYSDAHEGPTESAVREVFEEVGLVVEVDQLLGLYWVGSPLGWTIVVVEFLMRWVGGEPRETDETTAWGWYLEHELPEPIFGRHRQRIADGFAVKRGEARPPFVRAMA